MCSQLTQNCSCFTTSVETTDRETVLCVGGELDMVAAPLLSECVQAACSGSKPIVIDAFAVTFIDAAGLRGLLGHYRPEVLARMRVRSASPPLVRLLDLVGLTDLVEERHP